MTIDALVVSLLTLVGIRLMAMFVFIHLYYQKRDKKYILLAAGWLCTALGSIWALQTYVASGVMDQYFSSLLAGLGTLWILFGALLYFQAIQWRYIYIGSVITIVYGSLPFFGLSVGPSPGVLVQFVISLLLTFIVLFKRRIFIRLAKSIYFWLVLLAVLTDVLTFAFITGIVQDVAIGIAGTSIVVLVAIIFFLHLEYSIYTRSLKKSEEEYRSMIKNLMEGFNSVSIDGILLDYNKEFSRIFNLDPELDHRGIQIDQFWQNPDERKVFLEELLQSGAIRNYEINAKTATGDLMSVLATARLIRDEQDKPIRIEGCYLDITGIRQSTSELNELKTKLEIIVENRTNELHEKVEKLHKSEKAMLYMVEDLNNLTTELQEEKRKLELSNKELEAFTYSVSHDLRAPLRHINGFVEMLNENYLTDLPEQAQHCLSVITKAARQMGILIDELLQFSRMGRQELRKTKMDMNDLVKNVLETIVQNTNTREILWTTQKYPWVFGDSTLLKQVWINLLDNAVKYTSKNQQTEIEIGFTENETHFVFFVRDNGVGFNMKYAHKLFGVFQRLHSQAEFEGTGIGLANVQRIVHKHNGKVWAEAELGKGATFFFSLPKNGKELS
jgi:PAS domain S-box-containing protein